ncbi:MAG: nucleotidyltransferase family protein [Alphaproteobacteria bacterium]|nr:nucleotidyltransferase family protein [Alphaproteobacteria bacterium]MBM3951160.1 nucleotidyltransferase family protein [Rhodospirillales bacterium]
MTVAALILAAGRSSRMGDANKLLADLNGAPIVARVAEAALASRARPVVAVTGHEAAKVRAALAGFAIEVAHNPDYALGMSTSLKAGIAALRAKSVAGALVLLGDMPRVTAATIDALIAAFEQSGGRAICVPEAGGQRGNPVLWPHDLFGGMSALSGDKGARDLLARYADRIVRVPASSAEIFADVDTPDDLARARDGL